MKKLLLNALLEAYDFRSFKEKLIPALEAAIKEEAELERKFEELRGEMIRGFPLASDPKGSLE